MKKKQISGAGIIDNNGNLSMFMGEISEFFKKWKNHRVTVRFEVQQPKTSEALKGYYFNYVVPTIMNAIRENGDVKTESQTEQHLREISPIMWNENVDTQTGKYSKELRDIYDLSNHEMIYHLDFLKKYAAENYAVFIEEPRII